MYLHFRRPLIVPHGRGQDLFERGVFTVQVSTEMLACGLHRHPHGGQCEA